MVYNGVGVTLISLGTLLLLWLLDMLELVVVGGYILEKVGAVVKSE